MADQLGGASGNATAADLLTGYSASVASGAISGSMPNNGAVTITPSTANQTIAQGYHNGSGLVKGDPNLVAANILSGLSIFGVAGNLKSAIAFQHANGTKEDSGGDTTGWTTETYSWDAGESTTDSFSTLTVSGLSFTPYAIMIVGTSSSSNGYGMGVFLQSGFASGGPEYAMTDAGYLSSTFAFSLAANESKMYVESGGFQLPVWTYDDVLSWYAFGY